MTYSKITLEFRIDGQKTDVNFDVCDECGALVGNRPDHTAWHKCFTRDR